MVLSIADAFIRHQIYLERYKLGLDGYADELFAALTISVPAVLAAAKVGRMGEMNKRGLTKLIAKVMKAHSRAYSSFTSKLIAELKKFAATEAVVTTKIAEYVEHKPAEKAVEENQGTDWTFLLGLLALQPSPKGRARLWVTVANTPDAATGMAPLQLLKRYGAYTAENFRRAMQQAYVNNWSISETIKVLFGTASKKHKDGLVHKLRQQGASTLHTLVQHVSSRVQAGVASLFFKFYEWVSVIDSGTTDICRSRDASVYAYGKGPLPPAHYRCRSKAIPLAQGKKSVGVPNNFYDWLNTQPVAVQNDLIGRTMAGKIRTGRVKPTKYTPKGALTLSQFAGKVSMMTKPAS